MTVDSANKTQSLSFRENRYLKKLNEFSAAYSAASLEEKKALRTQFFELCQKSDKKAHLDTRIAEIFLILEPRDQRGCLALDTPERKKRVAKLLHAADPPNCFFPLFFLADQCVLQEGTHAIKKMSPLYKQAMSALLTHAEDKVGSARTFNQFIEQRLPSFHPPAADLPLIALPFERTALAIRQGICSVQSGLFFFAGTTTHQRIQSEGESIESDPYADDGAALEFLVDQQRLRLVSISDGGGKGEAVVKTAQQVNQLFLGFLTSHAAQIKTADQAADKLLQATFATQQALSRREEVQHATHASLLAVIPDTGAPYGAVSLLGDTIAYLLTETEEEIKLDKLYSPENEKHTSHTGGDFSSKGDYSSLTVTPFALSQVKRACIILGSDGLGDNLDPRNALLPALSNQLDSSPRSYYQKRQLTFADRKFSVSNALMNAQDQKDLKIFDTTHQFPTPWALQMDLGYQNLTPSERMLLETLPVDAAHTWNGKKAAPPEHQQTLIDLYAKVKIRSLYTPASPEHFANALVLEARRNGKSDDIIASVTWLKI